MARNRDLNPFHGIRPCSFPVALRVFSGRGGESGRGGAKTKVAPRPASLSDPNVAARVLGFHNMDWPGQWRGPSPVPPRTRSEAALFVHRGVKALERCRRLMFRRPRPLDEVPAVRTFTLCSWGLNPFPAAARTRRKFAQPLPAVFGSVSSTMCRRPVLERIRNRQHGVRFWTVPPRSPCSSRAILHDGP